MLAKKNIKWDYIFVFFVTLFLHFLMKCQTIDINLISDRIGDLAAPVTLAGLNWKSLIGEVRYYGYGYKWIYFVLFKMTDNPYFIYGGIIVFGQILIALTSVLIYHIQISYFNLKNNKGLAILLTVFVAIQASTGIDSEGSLWIACWITCYFTLKYINDDKRSVFHAIIMALWLAYTVTLHERMVALIFAFFILLIMFRIMYGRWIVEPKIYLGCQILFWFIVERFTDFYCDFFWGKTTVVNTSVIPKNVFWVFDGIKNFKVFVDGILCNLLTLNNKTYGVMSVGMALIVVSIFRIKSGNQSKESGEREERVKQNLHAIMWLFGICIMIVIVGLSIRWGYKITLGQMKYYKGFTYYRYYIVYAWPVLIATVIYLYHYKFEKWHKIIANGLFVGISGYFITTILPQLSVARDYFGKILLAKFFQNASIEVNLFISILITAFLLICCCIHKNKKVISGIVVIMLIVSFWNLTNHLKLSQPNIVCNAYENVYNAIKHVSQKEDIGTQIYTNYNPYTLQFMLNRYEIINDIYPGNLEEAIFITRDEAEVVEKNLPEYQAYGVIQLDGKYIYVKGNRLIQIFQNNGYTVQKNAH